MVLLAIRVGAEPLPISPSDFVANDAVIDFNSIENEELIRSQYELLGVSFDGAIYGMTNNGDLRDFPNNGGVIASNWVYSGTGFQGALFAASFDHTVTRVGFWVDTWDTDDVTIELFYQSQPVGSATFDTGLNPETGLWSVFVGLSESKGFDRIVVSWLTIDNGFMALDDFQFGDEASPDLLLRAMAQDVESQAPGRSLTTKIQLAQAYYAVPDIPSTCSMLMDLQSQANAQSGKKLEEAFASELIDNATEIMLAIDCD